MFVFRVHHLPSLALVHTACHIVCFYTRTHAHFIPCMHICHATFQNPCAHLFQADLFQTSLLAGYRKGGNTHLVSSETVWSQRTPQAKGGSFPPQPSRNQKQSLTPHAPSSRPAVALPAAQSLSAQVDMHIYTRSQPLAIVLHTIMQRSPLAYRWRQCPDGPVRRRACQLVTFFPLLRLSFRSSPPLLICLHWQFGGLQMPCSIRSIHLVDIRMITPASMNMFISMIIPVKLSR